MNREHGKIIFLNGPSSSGKTALAIELQAMLTPAYLYVSLDMYYAMLPKKVLENIVDKNLNLNKSILDWGKFYDGVYASVAIMAKTGSGIIFDGMCGKSLLPICVKHFESIAVIYVGLKCSLEELQRREMFRGNRIVGLAKSQHEKIHKKQIYDIEIDTTQSTPKKCALQIMKWINHNNKPTVFTGLIDKIKPDVLREN